MTRKLYMHMGPRKTATSTIQRLLSNHDNSVVTYPKTGLGGTENFHGHHGVVFRFFGETKGSGKLDGSSEDYFRAIGQEVKDTTSDIVISSEILQSRDIGLFLRELLPYIGEVDVEFIIACREHFARAASWYNHRLRAKRSGEKRTPDAFLLQEGASVLYVPFINELKQTGFNVTPLDYQPSDTWVRRFLMHIGFRENQIPEIKRELTASSSKLMIANLAVRNVLTQRSAQLQAMKLFKKMPQGSGASKFIFSPAAARETDHLFADDRRILEETYGISITPPDFDMRENMLSIGEEDFADIESIAGGLGKKGRLIADFARQYVR